MWKVLSVTLITKQTNLKLKTRPKQLLGYVPLAFALLAMALAMFGTTSTDRMSLCRVPVEWRHDTWHNNIQRSSIQHNEIHHNNIQHNDIQHNI